MKQSLSYGPILGACTLFHAQVRSAAGDWGEVRIPRSVKALVLLNIQSYAGGRDLWGLADTGADVRKGWRTPIFNDGLIEARPKKNGVQGLGCGGATCGAWLTRAPKCAKAGARPSSTTGSSRRAQKRMVFRVWGVGARPVGPG